MTQTNFPLFLSYTSCFYRMMPNGVRQPTYIKQKLATAEACAQRSAIFYGQSQFHHCGVWVTAMALSAISLHFTALSCSSLWLQALAYTHKLCTSFLSCTDCTFALSPTFLMRRNDKSRISFAAIDITDQLAPQGLKINPKYATPKD